MGEFAADRVDRLERLGRRRTFSHPGQVVVVGFATMVAVGTVLLMLPWSRAGGGTAPFLDALFTSTSAVCVTGLVTVDTGTYWSGFGQGVIVALFQVGGFGIMTMATLLGLLLARRLGLSSRLMAQAETKSVGLGDVRSVLLGVGAVTVVVEGAVALVLALRFLLAYDESPGRAVWLGVFHSISAFNNAGFGLHPDSVVRYVDDPWVIVPLSIAVVLGGIGFPVIFELRRHVAPRWWSLHTKITVFTSGLLLVGGFGFYLVSEWSNPATLGSLDGSGKGLAAFFHSVVARTAGFNSIDMSALTDGTLLGTIVLMFIGGGSAGTAGGIKVTTFALLFFVIWAEARGARDVNAFGRRIDPHAQRQALAVALLGVGAVMSGTLAILLTSSLPLADVWFEVTSAFATVGLSTGITADVPRFGQLVLVALMFLGRVGPVALVSALAYRQRTAKFTFPEGRPLLG